MPIAIVTGGSQGFGLALTAALLDAGWSVVTDARDGLRLAAATSGLTVPRATAGGPRRVAGVPGDVTDPAHRAELVAAAERLGGLDLLVHNASTLGPSPLPPLERYPLDDYRRVLDVNVVAPLALTQLALGLLRRAPAPAVVALSSDAAVEAYEGWGGYGSAKAALDHLVAVLGAEEPGLRTYAYDPGDLRTEMQQRAFPGEDISDRPEPATAVPPLLHLLATRPPNGRYRAADLVAAVTA